MSEDCGLPEVAALLEDDCVRTILTATSTQAMSATELSERSAASKATVYRRLEDLRACDLVVEETRPDPDGHHYKVYRANLDRITVDLVDDRFEMTIRRRESMADRFTDLIEGMR